jgi:DNA topoisomerase-1
MSENLVIVESPTKARTLSRFIGNQYKIEASMGHVRDLPKAKLGVDVEKDFEPQYVIPSAKRKTVEYLREIAREASKIILATDPDREGEAIAWHVQQLVTDGVQKSKVGCERIVFHEITKEAVSEALKAPRKLDNKLIDAQVARRVLDRLVGYKLSPLLWKKVKSGLSAGRVQSVAVRLIVEREREIEQFVPSEYWAIGALLKDKKASEKEAFEAKLVQREGKKIEVKNKKEAEAVVKDLESKDTGWRIANLEEKEVRKHPHPPFTTSTVTQTAANLFGFTTKKTMKLAQDLYEEGLITYHRTDSVNLSPIALGAARKYIKEVYGAQYLPPTARVYKTKSKLAQEAHEAIRPTKVGLTSEQVKATSPDHKKLYGLIWNRFVASQMAESVYDQVSLDISASKYLFKSAGSVIKFPGWLVIYGRKKGEVVDVSEKPVPALVVGTELDLLKLNNQQRFTEPPPRYTEASLIKLLEEKGIGRPSTYAPIISTIQERNYVELEQKRFRPTPLGAAVNDFLVKNFPGIVEVSFTAKMEDQLDDIANGGKRWVPIISEFYKPFAQELEKVFARSEKVKIFHELTSEKCPDGHPLIIRYGRFGKFLACENFPEHKYTKAFEEKIDSKCPESGDPIVIKRTRRGRPFYGCSGYPKCKWMSWKLPKKLSGGQEATSKPK